MEQKTKEVKIGYIELSGKAIVSDPGYDRDVRRNATNITVKPGKYAVFVTLSDEQTWGERVAYITAIHKDHMQSRNPVWKSYNADIDVDSGQCGIFDDTIYPQTAEACGSYDDENTFYGECCQLTLSEMQCGILKNQQGAVSTSGLGDGSYKLQCQYHEGECVALKVDFGVIE